MDRIKIGGIANTAFRHAQRCGQSHPGNKLLVVLEDGLDARARQAALKDIRAHDNVTVARMSDFGIVHVSTTPGADDGKTAESLKKITGVKHAEREACYYPSRTRRTGATL